MALPRIVITSLGGICGLGVDVPSIWQSLVDGRSAIGPITVTPLHELKVRIGAPDTANRYRGCCLPLAQRHPRDGGPSPFEPDI